ncbi:MAG: aldo/keto reductase [Spirochaetaceae bacterium]|jgi:predicted aldo/keto reductase-like oxidoreductase|nr:aldo/keto reductase [Spirochaetaceae bacterium]
MLYRPFGKTGKMLSALGIGTTRFPAKTGAGIENAVRLVLEAIDNGVNYIDTSHSYLGGRAEEIVGAALRRTGKEVYVTVKSSYANDRTADECYSRICASLEHIGIKKAHFFIMWSVFSYSDFLKMTERGGLYDGALRAKKEGLVDHICASLHCTVNDMIKIIESGLLEGITITYSVLNQKMMDRVLRRAAELNVGIVTMNTLGGGLIPQNEKTFSFIKTEGDATVSRAALSFCYAHGEITTMLSGMANAGELHDNLGAVLRVMDRAEAEKRIELAEKGFEGITGYCTGCGYCMADGGCPAGIDTAAFMYSYNGIFFPGGVPDFRRTEERMLENIRICYRLKMSFNILPESGENPCLECGNCEKKCTQKIQIIKRVREMYRRFDESGYNKKHIIKKITEAFDNNHAKIGLWPASVYTSFIIDYVREILPGLGAELFIFDKNEKLRGTVNSGIKIQNPALLPRIKPDAIVITNYNYEADIYESIKHYENDGIKVVKLHDKNDLPWGGF